MRRDWRLGNYLEATEVIQAKKRKLFCRQNGMNLLTERQKERKVLTTIPCFWFEKYMDDDKTRIRNPVGEGSLRTGEDDRCCLGQAGLEMGCGSRSLCGTLERDLTGATDGGVLSIRVRVDRSVTHSWVETSRQLQDYFKGQCES